MRGLCLVLTGVYLLASGCGSGAGVEAERPRQSSISEGTKPDSIQSAEQGLVQAESMSTAYERADQETVRLQPQAFEGLPAAVMAELVRRGCTIPQVYAEQGQGNVVKGQFTAPGQTDLAVLCSRERVSSILVFRNSTTADVVELASAPDRNYLQGIGVGRIGYSRALDAANPKFIQEHYEAYGSLKPPPLDHEGIDDVFIEKGSTVWYWYGGKWLQLAGSD